MQYHTPVSQGQASYQLPGEHPCLWANSHIIMDQKTVLCPSLQTASLPWVRVSLGGWNSISRKVSWIFRKSARWACQSLMWTSLTHKWEVYCRARYRSFILLNTRNILVLSTTEEFSEPQMDHKSSGISACSCRKVWSSDHWIFFLLFLRGLDGWSSSNVRYLVEGYIVMLHFLFAALTGHAMLQGGMKFC